MEIIEQRIKIDNQNFAKANYIYTVYDMGIDRGKNIIHTEEGLYIAKVKLKNDKEYSIYLTSNSNPTSLEEIRNNISQNDKEVVSKHLLDEYFINGMEKFLKFNSEAYFRIIDNEKNEEVKMIFTDYYEVIDYLESIDLL